MKKYEIYLPLKYNDGSEIEPEKFKEIREDLIATFGALTVSSQSAPYQGTWKYGGVDFIDDIIKIEIITGDDRKTARFMRRFKEHLKRVLQQIDILITEQDIRTI
ncbi:MAG: hypothetical protein Q8S00_02385 [Deltaproteobacteria bacterium]|nr:hypothetical protein [Deltaproteobacteria bacterium]MDZ4341026.1 hypothetical protein [Candidatus Binatia bacterium]